MELFYVTTLREFLLAMMMMIRGGLRCRIGSAASDFGSEGWGFDSLRGRHPKSRFAISADVPANIPTNDSFSP